MNEQGRFWDEKTGRHIHIAVDRVAPDFALMDENGKELSMKKYKGDGQLVLAFVKGGFNRFTREFLLYLKDDIRRIESFGGMVMAVTYGSIMENKAMADDLRLPFPVLSDYDCSVIKLYGLYNPYEKLIGPSVFVMGKTGLISYMYAGKNESDVISNEDLLKALGG